MKLQTFAIAIISLLVFNSCKKDKTNNCEKTMAAVSGTYSLIKMEANIGAGFVDADNREDCEKDDHIVLNANGTVEYKDDGTICDASGDDSGTWTIDSNGKITISSGGDVYALGSDITSFDCNTLVLSGTELGVQYRITFKK